VAPAARARGEKPTRPARRPKRNQSRKRAGNPLAASTGRDDAAAAGGGEAWEVSPGDAPNGAPQKAQAAVRQVL
jgi:hypothetical protein